MYHENINFKMYQWLYNYQSDFRAKRVIRATVGHYIMIMHQEDSNPKCVCTEQQRCKICEAKTDGTEEKNKTNPQLSMEALPPLSQQCIE